jgi:hypothetical protein
MLNFYPFYENSIMLAIFMIYEISIMQAILMCILIIFFVCHKLIFVMKSEAANEAF